MDFQNMSDQELLDKYYAIKGVIDECGAHEKSLKAYFDCTTEIANRYFDSVGLINLENRKKLIELMIGK